MLACVVAAGTICAESPKREFRSVWMAAMGIDWPRTAGTDEASREAARQELVDYLDSYKQHNFTGVCIHVRPLADALYKSSYEPWSASVSGKRGVDPGWDPLAFAVSECHRRGLECYAWVNPFRIDHNGKLPDTPQDIDWRERGLTFTQGTWTVFNPGLPEAREHCMKVIEEIYTNYKIDGLLFDDYFYPGVGMPKGDAEADAPDFKLWKDSGSGLSIADWRRNNVNTFVKELYDRIQKARPDMRFGIGPAGVGGKGAANYGLEGPGVADDWMYDDIFCDPLAWLNDGSVDFIAPQIYWGRSNSYSPFSPLCKWWADMAEHFGRHNYVSMASYRVDAADFGGNNEKGWAEFAAQIRECREEAHADTPGQIYYSAKFIDGPVRTGLGAYLAGDVYCKPALVPVVDWKAHVVYEAPQGVAATGADLRWRPVQAADNVIIRYSVYAIPCELSMDDASTGDDGIDSRYLLGVSYVPAFALPADKVDGFRYAVCVYDGYGYESAPGIFDPMASQGVEFMDTDDCSLAVDGLTISLDSDTEYIYVYTLCGTQVAVAAEAAVVEVPAPGTYLIVTPRFARTIIVD